MGDFLGVEMPLDNLDFNLEAFLGWINLTLAALSKAEKTACKFLADLVVLAFLIKESSLDSLCLFLAALILSFLTFLIADRMIGMDGILTGSPALFKFVVKLSAGKTYIIALH